MSWALAWAWEAQQIREAEREHKEITRAAKQTRTAAGQEVTLHFFFEGPLAWIDSPFGPICRLGSLQCRSKCFEKEKNRCI